MKYVTAIVLAAGKSLRFGLKISKPLVEINRKPIIIYCLKILNTHPYIRDIVVVGNSKNLRAITAKIKQYRINKIRDVVLGGLKRQDSVCQGLRAIAPATDLVLIHDAVRPFIDKGMVSALIKEADKTGAAIAGVPVKATIKSVVSRKSSVVSKTLNRDELWEIQTPQVFKKDLILKAYDKFGKTEVTDDAALVERLGARVNVVLGSYKNIKITTPEDLGIAQAIFKKHKL